MCGNLNLSNANVPANAPVFLGANGIVERGEFRGNVARCAAFFSRRPEREFALFTENFPRFCTWFLALLAAGKDIVLPPHLREGMRKQLRSRDIPVVTDIADFGAFPPPLPKSLPAAEDFRFPDFGGRVISFFTSGSTSDPKLIRKKFETIAAEVDFHLREATFPGDAPLVVASVSAHHMLGLLHRFLIPLKAGFPMAEETLISVEDLAELRERGTKIFLVTTPSFLDKVAANRALCAFPRDCVRIVSSGAALRKETADAALEIFGVSPYEIFGSTEAGGVAFRRQERGSTWTLFPCVHAETDALNRPLISSPFCGEEPFLMQDAISLTGTRSFELHGRLDRLVKIAEHRVLLPEIEAGFEKHEFVARAHFLLLDGARPRLGALLEPTVEGAEFLKKNTKRAFVARLKTDLGDDIDPFAFPKKIRIVREIPTNAQGKFVRNELMPLFKSSIAEPVTENLRIDENSVSAELTFVPESIYFRGHFPGVPILPGVVQTHFAYVFAKRFLNVPAAPKRILKLKFVRIISPGETVSLTLERRGNDVAFTYSKAGAPCSSGVLCGEK